MKEKELSNTKQVVRPDLSEIVELQKWFRTTYVERKLMITRYNYLKIPTTDTLYALECEAYEKEQKLRELQGKSPLPQIKIGGIF